MQQQEDSKDQQLQQQPDSGPSTSCGRVSRGCPLVAHTCGLLVFGYSLLVQYNDETTVGTWIAFYGALTLLSLLGCGNFFLYCCASGTHSSVLRRLRILRGLVAATILCGGCVLSVLSIVQLRRARSGGPRDGGDNDGATNRQERIYELCGAVLGFVVAAGNLLAIHRGKTCRTSATTLTASPPDELGTML